MTKPNHTMTSAAMVVSMVEHRTQKAAETSSTRAMSVVSSRDAQVGLLISDTAKIEVGVTAHIRRGSSHRIAE